MAKGVKVKKGILLSMLALGLVLGLALPMATPLLVDASANIDLVRSPNPPCYLLNNGATPQALWWKITFDTTPDEAVLTVLDPDGVVVHTETFDLTGRSSPVYNPENTIGDAGTGNAAYAHNWNFGPGIKTGTYRAQLNFYSNIGRESSAMQTFWIMQRVQVYKYNDLNGNGGKDGGEPPLSGWDFTVSGPESFSGTTDSSGYAIFPSRNPTSPCALGTEAYRDVVASGTYTVTETLKLGWTNTDPGGSAPYKKSFTVPHPAGQPIVIQFGNRQSNPDIDLEKHVREKTNDWEDADTPTGPYLLNPAPSPVIFGFVIENTGSVALANVTLSDTHMSTFYTNEACTAVATFPIATLAKGAKVTYYGKLNWAMGQHANVATVEGYYGAVKVDDSDPAHYFGEPPPQVGWETYPIDKLRVLLPWIAVVAAVMVGAGLVLLNRRRT